MKRKLFILIVLVFVFTTSVFAFVLGDVDGNGSVSSSDYILVRKYLLNLIKFSNDQIKRADVNGDNKVSSADYILIRKILLKIPITTPTPLKTNPPVITPSPTIAPKKKLTATFKVQDSKVSSEKDKTVSCEVNTNNRCSIIVPNLNTNSSYQFLGWSNKTLAKSANYKANNSLELTQNITLYDVTPQIVTITFNVSDNVDSKNVKAEKLSFNYTNSSGNTIVEKENSQSLTETCLSFNGEGCKIKTLPTVYAKGYFVHGFSKSIGGKNIYVLNTTFKANTTIYARVGYSNSTKINHMNIGYQKLYGNVMFEAESSMSTPEITVVVNVLDQIYKYFPEVFYYNGKLFMLSESTYNNVLSTVNTNISGTSGYTLTGTNYNNSFFKYNSNINEMLVTMVHEMGHSFDNSFSNCISDRTDVIDIYNKYKAMPNRPFRDYTYYNTMEFYGDLFANVMADLLHSKTNYYYYQRFTNIPSEFTSIVSTSLIEKKSDLRSLNLIR